MSRSVVRFPREKSTPLLFNVLTVFGRRASCCWEQMVMRQAAQKQKETSTLGQASAFLRLGSSVVRRMVHEWTRKRTEEIAALLLFLTVSDRLSPPLTRELAGIFSETETNA